MQQKLTVYAIKISLKLSFLDYRPAEKRYATNFSSNSKNQLKLMPEVCETSNYVKSHVVFLLKIAIGMRHDFKNLNFTDFMLHFHPK